MIQKNFPFPVGIATSVSAAHDFDPLDTAAFLKEHPEFRIIQVYLNGGLVKNTSHLEAVKVRLDELAGIDVYYHLCMDLGASLKEWEWYFSAIRELELHRSGRGFIIHMDPARPAREAEELLGFLTNKKIMPLWLENYFSGRGSADYLRQLQTYRDLFRLFRRECDIRPVLDIPRFFHRDHSITHEQSTRDVRDLLEKFAALGLPILLHAIDVTHPRQHREDFCPLGKGTLPYGEIFSYLRLKNLETGVSGLILEYEDKRNPLDSLDFLLEKPAG